MNWLSEFNTISICLRLFLATFMGGAIGFERSTHGQPAGIRTFSLVCMGSALVIIVDEYLVDFYQTGDPARLAAQVISGIGFLGAGSILVTGRNYIRGLTTAASLWATACLGIAVGSGYFAGSIAAFVMLAFVMTVMTKISHRIDENLSVIKLYLEVDRNRGLSELNTYVKKNNYTIVSIEKQKKTTLQAKDIVLLVSIDLKKRSNHMDILSELNQFETIHYIEEMR